MNFYFFLSKILSPLLLFSNIMILFIIISFIFRNRFKKIFYTSITIFFLIALLGVLIGNSLTYHILKKDFYNKKTVDNFDAMLVLGGDERRIAYAVNLIKKHNNAKLVFAGGYHFLVKNTKDDEHKRLKKLMDNTIESDSFYILASSRNTIENMIRFKEFNKVKKFKKVILLTSPSHMKRALIISRKMGLNIHPYYWKREKINFSLINYYQSFSFVDNIRSFDTLFKEFLGILSLYFVDLKNY